MEEYLPLCRAIVRGDWDEALKFFALDENALTAKLDVNGSRALHLAIDTGDSLQFVRNLLEKLDENSLPYLLDNVRRNPLHYAATVGNTTAAMMLVEKNPSLLFIFDLNQNLPIHRAVFGHHIITSQYLHKASVENIDLCQQEGYENPFKDRNGAMLLVNAINQGFIDFEDVLTENQNLGKVNTVQDIENQEICIYTDFLSTFRFGKSNNSSPREFISRFATHYYMAIWSRMNDYIIIQFAIINRCEKVYNLLVHEMSTNKFLLKIVKDKDENNLLHLAGKLPPIHKLNEVSGAALQMQRELQWFQEVEKLVQPNYRETTNRREETPMMVFRREHKELRKEGEEWMKKTADSYTITAALIITIVFAAAITVPGGNDGDTGKAIYATKPSFLIFAISDAVSLFTSTTSLLFFLSILTARYREEDFLYRLPLRLLLGLVMLFLSVTSMIIAFGATLYLMFGQGKAWIVIPIGVLACVPIASFIALQFHLLVELIFSTYGRGIFGKQNFHM